MEHIVIFLVGLLLFLIGAIFSVAAMVLLVSSKSKIESYTAETTDPVNINEYYVQERKVGAIVKIFMLVGIVLLLGAAVVMVVFAVASSG